MGSFPLPTFHAGIIAIWNTKMFFLGLLVFYHSLIEAESIYSYASLRSPAFFYEFVYFYNQLSKIPLCDTILYSIILPIFWPTSS